MRTRNERSKDEKSMSFCSKQMSVDADVRTNLNTHKRHSSRSPHIEELNQQIK
jgi:hypothetical protein